MPLLGDWLHGEQLLDSEELENLEREFGRKVADNIERRLGVLLQQKNLQANVPWHARVEDD